MRKQYTPAPTAHPGVIVFGLLKGHKAPSAGLFTGTALGTVTEAARRQGLSALRLPNGSSQRWRNLLARGSIAQNGRLELQAIRPSVLDQLQAMNTTGRGRQRHPAHPLRQPIGPVRWHGGNKQDFAIDVGPPLCRMREDTRIVLESADPHFVHEPAERVGGGRTGHDCSQDDGTGGTARTDRSAPQASP